MCLSSHLPTRSSILHYVKDESFFFKSLKISFQTPPSVLGQCFLHQRSRSTKLDRNREQRLTHLLIAVEIIDDLGTIQKSHLAGGRYYFGHVYDAYVWQANNLHTDTDSNQFNNSNIPHGNMQQSHFSPHLSNLTCILHPSPLYPGHCKVCKPSWAVWCLSE